MAIFDSLKNHILRALGRQKSQLPPFNHALNPYKARHPWPPVLGTLSKKQQFRFERKFKRRLTNKAVQPEWNKKVRIVTWTIISATVIYAVWFYDHASDPWNPNPGEQPFQSVRVWTRDFFAGVFPEGWWTYTGNVMSEEEVRELRVKRLQEWKEEGKEVPKSLEEKLGLGGLVKDVHNRAVRRVTGDEKGPEGR